MARQTLNKGTTANDGTGDTLRTAAGKINDNFEELYSFLGGDALTDYVNLSDSGLVYNHVINSGFKTVLTADSSAASYEVNLPAGSGSLILETSTATLTNKTLTSPLINNPTIDGLKVNDDDSSHQYTLVAGSLTGNRNISLPSLTGNDTFVFQAHTQTLSNKTLAAPSITTAINDANGAEIVKFTATTSAINEITVKNNSAGADPEIQASGTDTNINLDLIPKGTGAIKPEKVAYGIKNLGAGIAASDSDTQYDTIVIGNFGSPKTFNLNDGTVAGEYKIIINKGAGLLTCNLTSDAYSSIAIKQHHSTSCVWDATANSWYVIYGGDSGDARVNLIV